MRLRQILFTLVVAGAAVWVANAQFPRPKLPGGITGATDKAKPATDRAQKAADTFASWPAEQEQQIGESSAAKMIAVFGLTDHDKATEYVNLVGSAVAKFAPRSMQYRFGILNTDMVGAFALPGGYIFVTTQALAQMNNEAELAGVLGHEIIHVAERHLESEIRSSKTSTWAVQEARTVRGPAMAEQFRAQGEALVKDLFSMKLSRTKEDGADERGAALAVQAGYAANGLLNFLTTLRDIFGVPDGERALGQLLSTHPSLDERIARLKPWVERNSKSGETLEKRFKSIIK